MVLLASRALATRAIQRRFLSTAPVSTQLSTILQSYRLPAAISLEVNKFDQTNLLPLQAISAMPQSQVSYGPGTRAIESAVGAFEIDRIVPQTLRSI
jgi:hypothetical protein